MVLDPSSALSERRLAGKNRNALLLLTTVLLFAGAFVFVLMDGSMGGEGIPPAPALESAGVASPSPITPTGSETGGEPPGSPGRTLLESPAPPEPAQPEQGSSLLEGFVRDSRGKGLSGIEVELISTPNAVREGFLFLHKSLVQLHQEHSIGLKGSESVAPQGPELAAVLTAKNAIARVAAHARRMGWSPLTSCRTDGQGRYRIDPVHLPGGNTALFLALSPVSVLSLGGGRMGLFPDPVRLEERHLGPGRGPELVFRGGGRIEGSVAGMGAPGDEVQVLAWRLGEKGPLDRRSTMARGTPFFLLDGLGPGVWRLGLLRHGGNPAFSWGPVLSLAEGQVLDRVALAFAPSASLEVEVYGPDRIPLAIGCWVEVHLVSLGRSGEEGAECPGDEALFHVSPKPGEPWRLERLVPGRYKVQASLVPQPWATWSYWREKEIERLSFPSPVARVVELPQGHARVELVLESLPALIDVVLGFTDRRGAPVAEGNVALVSESWRPVALGMRTAKTGPDGVVEFPNVLPLAYSLTVRARGFLMEQVALDLTAAPRGATVRRNVILRRGGVIVGRLLDSEGQGVPRARIWAKSVEEGAESHWFSTGPMMTDKEGAFRIEGLGRGRWALEPRLRDKLGAQVIVEVEEEESKEVVLRFR